MFGLCWSCCKIETVTNLALGDLEVATEPCEGLERTKFPPLSVALDDFERVLVALDICLAATERACLEWTRDVAPWGAKLPKTELAGEITLDVLGSKWGAGWMGLGCPTLRGLAGWGECWRDWPAWARNAAIVAGWGDAVGVVKGVRLGDAVVLGVEWREEGGFAVGVCGKRSLATRFFDTAISDERTNKTLLTCTGPVQA